MKKKSCIRIAAVLASALLCGVLAGCTPAGTKDGSGASGSSADASQGAAGQVNQVTAGRVYAKDIDLSQYITLKDYQGFRVPRTGIEVNEQDVKDIVDNVYINTFPAELGVKDRSVVVGDTANIDYAGVKDGVAFEGGTAQGTNLTIGSGRFINGFEDGLVGVMPGETVDLNLTFPEDYGNADLAGQAVVFTVTVNYIIPEEKMDEAIQGFIPEVNSIADLNQYVYDYLYQTALDETQEEYEEEIMDTFLTQYCEFKELPQDWVNYHSEQARNYFVTAAFQMGTDPSTLVETYYGMSLEDFLAEYSDIATRRDIAMQAVVKQEGLGIPSDEELDRILEQYAADSGCESVADYLGEASKEDFRQDYNYEQAFQFIIDLAGKQ